MSMTIYDLMRTITTARDGFFEQIIIEGREFPIGQHDFLTIVDSRDNLDVDDLNTVNVPQQVADLLRIPREFLDDDDLLESHEGLAEYHALVEAAEGLIEDGILADEVNVFKVTDDETLVINGDF